MTPRKARWLATFASWIVRALIFTLRIRIDDRAGVTKGPHPPVIWLFWHNRLLMVPYLSERYLPHRPGTAMTSASKDGEILAAFLEKFNILASRGSSSRRGVAALVGLVRALRNGREVAITPDGPRGPRYVMNPGVVTLAQSTGAKVMPIRIHYSRCWRLKSWDAFMIPKPFSRVEIVLGPLETAAATTGEEEFERERSRIESILREGQVEKSELPLPRETTAKR